jgi:hypothetical protein
MSTISIAQSALAPLPFARQQSLYRAELGERVISEKPMLCTVKRHIVPPRFEKRTCPVTVFEEHDHRTTVRQACQLQNSKRPF